MAKLNLYFNPKKYGKDGQVPVLISISHNSVTSYIKTGVLVADNECINGEIVLRKDAKRLNQIIKDYLHVMELRLGNITRSCNIAKINAKQLRDMLLNDTTEVDDNRNNFIRYFNNFISNHPKASTQTIYNRTLTSIKNFDADIEHKKFEDIDKTWLTRYKNFLLPNNKLNTIAIHLRNIRAVFNDAIDEEVTTAYPFRKFPIQTEKTEKLPFTLEQVRMLWLSPLEDWQKEWVDLAKLVFMLIGINMTDLATLTQIDKDNRIRYKRDKTGRDYSIKVEPEMKEIIDRWKGESHLLSVFDRYKDYHNANQHMVHAVKCIGMPSSEKGGRGKKAEVSRHSKAKVTTKSELGDFCLYSLRRAWATIAFNDLNVPMEVISMALGHSDGKGLSVTQRYVAFDLKKVDEVNRKMLDWIVYNKKG